MSRTEDAISTATLLTCRNGCDCLNSRTFLSISLAIHNDDDMYPNTLIFLILYIYLYSFILHYSVKMWIK
jgi:hypothetical protein